MSERTASGATPANAGSGGFVGRAAEFAELRSALRETLGGRGRFIMLAGEAGIGKTRLAEELCASARCDAIHVAWGRCWESGTPAYWPWIQVMRECAQIRGFADALSELGPSVRYIARILPDPSMTAVGSAADELTLGARLDSLAVEGPVNFRLFDTMGNLLRRLAGRVALLVVLDDIHWADPDSLQLLNFLARELRATRVMFVAGYRELEAREAAQAAPIFAELTRAGQRIPLRGLNEAEVASFVSHAMHEVPPPELVVSLTRMTGGNPFFLDEIVHLVSARKNAGELGALGVPEGVRAVVSRRVHALSEPVRRALVAASVIGEEFTLGVLGVVLNVESGALLDALEGARAAELIEPVTTQPGGYRFGHAIIAHVLRDEIAAAELMRLHRRVAEALETSHSGELDSVASRLTYHWAEALPLGTAEQVVSWATRGAQRARTQLAYREAARLYRIADNAVGGTHRSDAERCGLLLALGEAEAKAGNATGAREALQRSLRLAQALPDPTAEAKVALAFGDLPNTPGATDLVLVDLLERAHARVGREHPALRAGLMARLARALYWSEQRQRVVELSHEAIEVARESGDGAALLHALWAEGNVAWSPDNTAQRLSIASELAALAEQRSDIDGASRAREVRIAALLELGDIQRAEPAIADYARFAENAGTQSALPSAYRVSLMLLRGDFDAAEHLVREAMEAAQRRQETATLMMLSGHQIWLMYERGQARGCIPSLKASAAQFPALSIARCALALCHAQERDAPAARAEFEYLANGDFSGIRRDWNWLAAIAAAAVVCNFLDDRERAAVLYQLMSPYADRNVTLGWGETCYGSAALHLGLLAHAMRRYDDAAVHFEAALEANLKMGARPALAHTQVAYGRMLLARAMRDDLRHAAALARDALATAEALGMSAVAREAQEILDSAAESSASPDSGPATVFRREGEVWAVSAEGGALFRLKDSKGLGYLATLLRNPGVEFHVLDLSVGESATEPVPAAAREEPELGRRGTGDAGAMLDAQAKAEYRRRLGELREELEQAKARDDVDRGAEIEDEIEVLTRELARAIGLGGRDRRAASGSERARLNVTRAVKAAIDRIANENPALALHLSKAIRTGTFCSYLPDPRAPLAWHFQ